MLYSGLNKLFGANSFVINPYHSTNKNDAGLFPDSSAKFKNAVGVECCFMLFYRSVISLPWSIPMSVAKFIRHLRLPALSSSA